MSWFQALLASATQSYAEYDVIWGIGDSISRGYSDAVGPTPTAETVYQWDAGAGDLREITNLDLLEPVAAGRVGSQWPAFGIEYYTQNNRKPVIVNTGIGTSSFINSDADFSWASTGNCFGNSLTKLNNCLTFMDKTAPSVVIIMLGINDVINDTGVALADIQDLIDRILVEFPGVRICITQPFAPSVTSYAAQVRQAQMRKWIKSLCFTYSEVELCGDLATNSSWGSNFLADDLHLNFSGNLFYGRSTARGVCASLSHNKWTRFYQSGVYNPVSETRLGWLDTLFSDLGAYWQDIDVFQILSTAGYVDASNQRKNAMIDLAGICWNTTNSPNSQYDFSGWTCLGAVDTDRITKAQPSFCADKASLTTDFIALMYVITGTTAAGTTATAFGVRESAAGGIFILRQIDIGTTVGGFAESATATNDAEGETKFNGTAWYGIGRQGGTQEYIKNTDVDTAAVAAVAPGATAVRPLHLGNYNNNNSILFRWSGKSGLYMMGKRTTINLSTVQTAMNTFLANWLTSAT